MRARRMTAVLSGCCAIAVGVAPAAWGSSEGGRLRVTTSGCEVRVRDVTMTPPVPLHRPEQPAVRYAVSLRMLRSDGDWSTNTEDLSREITSLDALREVSLQARSDLPMVVHVTAMRIGGSDPEIAGASTVVQPHGCTSAQVQTHGVLTTGFSWRPSRTGRGRTYILHVRCSDAYRFVAVRRGPFGNPFLGSSRCNGDVRIRRPGDEGHRRWTDVPFPLAFRVEAMASRAAGSAGTGAVRCSAFLRPRVLLPARGSVRALVCDPVWDPRWTCTSSVPPRVLPPEVLAACRRTPGRPG